MKLFTKGLLLGAIVGGISTTRMLIKMKKETPTSSTKDIEEFFELQKDWEDKNNRLKHAVQHVQELTQQELTPFIKETKQSINDFKFQTKPRINQLSKQTEKILSEFPKEI